MKKIFKLFSLLAFTLASLLALCSFCYASDVSGTVQKSLFESGQVGYKWDISGVIDATGDSNVMVGSLDCDEYTLFIKTSGTVSLSVATKVNYENANWSTCVADNTYTFTSAGTYKYTWTAPTPYFMISVTRTTGQIDDTVVYCRTK